jgi:Ca2+-binding EF-hand superfamily protein
VKLTRKQIGLDEATFRLLDKNGDGKLDSKELPGFIRRPPDLEVTVRLGGKTAGVEVRRDRPLSGQTRKLDDLTLLDLGATQVEMRHSEEQDTYNAFSELIRQQVLIQFKTADKDKNGYLDKQEMEKSPGFGELFKQMDRDGDGKLYEKEVIAFLDEYQKIQQKATASCVTLVLKDQSRGLFDLLDVNRDGKLSVREMRAAVRLLKRLDRDNKGYLTRDDIPRSYQMTLKRGSEGDDIGNLRAVAALYGGAGQGKPEKQSTLGPLWFRKMDRNRDGDVSRKEWLFSDELFRKIDTDGDGLISVAEAEAYDAQRRKQK